MINAQAKKFGDELRKAREEKNLTLKDIYAQTRIDEKYLEALEQGDFSVLPEVYIRAFIREYSVEVDLNPDEMLKKYELAKQGMNYIKPQEETEINNEFDGENEIEPETKIFEENNNITTSREDKENKQFYYYIASGLAFLLILFYVIFGNSEKEQIVVENNYENVKTEEKIPNSNSTENKLPEVSQNSDISKTNFELKLKGIDTVWIRVQIDEKKTNEFTLFPGVSRIINVNEKANVLIGNSGGVEIFVDENKIDFNGAKGKIKNLLITKNGIENSKNRK